MRQPVNLWDLNKLDEWEGDIKIIITCRGDYLDPYSNHTTFFIPDNEETAFNNYEISDIDTKQIKKYIQMSFGEKDEKYHNSLAKSITLF